MKAYRIQNALVAAHDEQEAIKAWAEHYNEPETSAGPVEETDLDTYEISMEEEDETCRDGKLAEVMPVDGPACVVASGDCEDCHTP